MSPGGCQSKVLLHLALSTSVVTKLMHGLKAAKWLFSKAPSSLTHLTPSRAIFSFVMLISLSILSYGCDRMAPCQLALGSFVVSISFSPVPLVDILFEQEGLPLLLQRVFPPLRFKQSAAGSLPPLNATSGATQQYCKLLSFTVTLFTIHHVLLYEIAHTLPPSLPLFLTSRYK
jgi:hypothetical protein